MGGTVLVFNSMAFILIFLGVFIWKTKRVELVAGYEAENTTDPDALAKCVGINLVIMGVLILSGNFLGLLFPGIPFPYKLGFLLLVIAVFSIRTVSQCRKYEKNGS